MYILFFLSKITFKEEVGMPNSLDLDQTRLSVRSDPGTNRLPNINTRTYYYFVCLSMQLKYLKHIHIND